MFLLVGCLTLIYVVLRAVLVTVLGLYLNNYIGLILLSRIVSDIALLR